MMASSEAGPINLGYREQHKLVEVARKIITLTKSQSEVIFKPPLMFMTPLGLPDITLAKEKLHWFPLVDLDSGLAKTVEYIKASRLLLQPLAEKYDQE
jgi:UDP-glucuronate decarboxylase